MTNYGDEFTRPHYLESIKSIAKEALEQDEDARDDFIHESVDGSRWVFIHYGARKTLDYSTNRETLFDEMGAEALTGCESLGEVNVRAAFYAMRADVAEALAELLDEAKEAEAEA